MQRINRSEPGQPTVSQSDRRFRFADGRVDEAQKVVEQPITSGLLAGKSVTMHLIDKTGNDTCPLLSIHDMRRLRMVVDYEEGKVMFKDNPDVWHALPTTRKGLMMIPLTEEACERLKTEQPPPKPTHTRPKRARKVKSTKFPAATPTVHTEGLARNSHPVATLFLSQQNHSHHQRQNGYPTKTRSGIKSYKRI